MVGEVRHDSDTWSLGLTETFEVCETSKVWPGIAFCDQFRQNLLFSARIGLTTDAAATVMITYDHFGVNAGASTYLRRGRYGTYSAERRLRRFVAVAELEFAAAPAGTELVFPAPVVFGSDQRHHVGRRAALL